MTSFNPLKKIPKDHNFKAGDTLVVFGEVFDRGYVNGIIDEALKAKMKVIYSTVGRRDKDGELRKLNEEELAEKQSPLINIPLEAGFDLCPSKNSISPVDQLKGVGLKGWEDVQLNWKEIASSKEIYKSEFRFRVKDYVTQLKRHINTQGNIVFVHTMAGGFPRAKAVMPIANKVFKGTGDRYQSSEDFWKCDIGKLCAANFEAVTADTLECLISETANIAKEVIAAGHKVSYLAYGYHGNEVMIGDKYEWHSYSPYLQGWAKMKLEEVAQAAWNQGTHATVFNVPEILTNSSSIFLGIEVVLYPLLRALKHDHPNNSDIKKLIQVCSEKLVDGKTYDDIDQLSQDYLNNPLAKDWPSFDGWPQHNGPEQMQLMRDMSTAIIELHKSNKDLMTKDLSEIIFKACGFIMLREAFNPSSPVLWIGHNRVSEAFESLQLN